MKVIVYNIFGLGHINPTLALVTALCESGAEVIYHSSPERKELIENTGATFRNYGRDDYRAADFNPGKNFVLQTLPATIGLLPFLTEEILREKPDLILYDSMAPWGKVLSHIFAIPAVCLVTTMALSKTEKTKMFAQHSVVPDKLNLSVLKKIKDDLALELDFDCVLGAYNECNLVFTSEILNPPLGELHQNHFHFVGSPARSEELIDLKFLMEKKNKKVITMALGSLLPEEDPGVIEWYRHVIRAFSSDERFRVVLATGNEKIRTELGQLAPNTVAFVRIPQLEVLKHTDVFIHHGGMNSISESISAGVPMLIIPHSKDQFSNSARVSELGVGVEIRAEVLETELLKAKVLDLMFSPRIQNRVRALKKSHTLKNPMTIIMECLQ